MYSASSPPSSIRASQYSAGRYSNNSKTATISHTVRQSSIPSAAATHSIRVELSRSRSVVSTRVDQPVAERVTDCLGAIVHVETFGGAEAVRHPESAVQAHHVIEVKMR